MADALTKQGVTGVKAQMKVQKSAQRHADKLRRSRARMISRTEIKNAQVQGQLTSMRQAVSDGLADPATAGKQWVTGATDVCNICSDLGFGKAIPLDQSFEGGFDGPTAHPNCRCDVAFVHTLSQAPKAHGAAGPNSPYRPGTPENPIVWEFPSGFRTQPSATRLFTPPGFVPPVPPPAAPAPAKPQAAPTPAKPQAAPTPAKPQAAPPEPMPANNAVPKARDYDPDGSIDQFPDSVSGRELARSKDVKGWPDASSYDEWIDDLPKRVENAKIGGDPAGLNLGPRPGLYESIEQTREIGMPIEVSVRADGTLNILSGGHRLAIADDLNLPVRVRWFGKGYNDLADALKVHPVDGSQMAGSMSIKEWKALTAKFKQTGGSYEQLLAKPPTARFVAEPGAPASNAEIVWDDAGRKWADLTNAERDFLLDSHLDDLLRQSYDDVSGVLAADLNPVVSRPPLPDDASDGVKAIVRQADRVDELKATQTRHAVEDDLLWGKGAVEGRFDPTRFRDKFYGWADDTYEGFVPGEAKNSFTRVKFAGERGTGIPGSTRRLVRNDLDDLIDPNGVIGNDRLHRAMERVFVEERRAASVIAELETEMTKLGTMIRTEAAARQGGEVVEVPKNWVTQLFPKAKKGGDPKEAWSGYEQVTSAIQSKDRLYVTFMDELNEASDAAGAGRLPKRSREGRRPRFDTRSEELEYLAVWEPLEGLLGDTVHNSLGSIAETMRKADDYSRINSLVQTISDGARSRIRMAYDPIEEAVNLLDEAITALRSAFPEEFAARPLTTETTLNILRPSGGSSSFTSRLERRIAKQSLEAMADAQTHIDALIAEGFDEIAEAVAENVRLLYRSSGGKDSYAFSLASSRSDATLLTKVAELTKVMNAGDTAGVERLLLGQLSRVGSELAPDLRSLINEVLREVRLIGGETFTIETGMTVQTQGGFKSITPRVREALDSMEEAVDDWMPTDWITRSNERGRLGFNGEGGRAHYRDGGGMEAMGGGDGLISIGKTGSVPDQSTMLHEVSHRGQLATPLHQRLERQWVERRIADTDDVLKQELRRLNDIKPGGGYEHYEWAVEDEFINPYIGKDYGMKGVFSEYRETTPMAIQEISGLPGYSGSTLDADLDMIDWILGMMAGV